MDTTKVIQANELKIKKSLSGIVCKLIENLNNMKKNMGTIDRVIRILLAVAIVALYYTNQISRAVATIGLVFASIFIVTSFMSFCPLYLPFGISTRKKEKKEELIST